MVFTSAALLRTVHICSTASGDVLRKGIRNEALDTHYDAHTL